MFKRAFDVLSSAAVLVVISPLLALLWLAIRLDSPGPALFVQTRIGRGQQPFQIYKFRSMFARDPSQIDQHGEQVIVGGRDPRITRVGRWIRAASLDELPQLLNILKGDMSVVGPRPIIPEQLEVVPPELMRRFEVRPGLTGLAQVRGRRSLGWISILKADNEYVDKAGLWYDLGIILRTVYVVLTGAGVYGGNELNWRAYRDQLRAEQVRKEEQHG